MEIERLVVVEESLKSAHKRLDDMDSKKLSKHEFNGFQQVMDSVKHTFHDSIKELGETTDKNTKAINALQTTFDNIEKFVEKFMPKFFKLLYGLIGLIIMLFIFIFTKVLHLW